MNFRNTFAIAVLFLALGGYLYFFESEKIRKETEGKKLFPDVKVEDVSAVTLTYPEQQIVLKKTGAGWQLQKPIEAAADETTVKNLVRAVTEAELKRTLEGKPESTAVFGLERPAATVALELANGTKLPSVRVGKTTPVGYSTFIQLEGSEEVKLVPSAFYYGMKKEVKDLRDKTILDFKDEDVQAVEVTAVEPPITLEREAEDWRITRPRALRADSGEVRSFLSSLRTLKAENFYDHPQDLSEFGLESPRRRIALLVGKDRARKELVVGGEREREKKRELYLKRAEGDTVFAVGTYAWASLDKDLADFRDKTVLSFERDQVGRIEVARKDGDAFTLVKTEAPAATPGPTPGPAKAEWAVEGAAKTKEVQASQLIGDLHGLKGYEIAAESPADLSIFGLAEPDLRFTLYDSAGKPIGAVVAAQQKGEAEGEKASYAKTDGSPVVFKIRDYIFSNLDKKREDLVEAEQKQAAAAAETPAPTPTPGSS